MADIYECRVIEMSESEMLTATSSGVLDRIHGACGHIWHGSLKTGCPTCITQKRIIKDAVLEALTEFHNTKE